MCKKWVDVIKMTLFYVIRQEIHPLANMTTKVVLSSLAWIYSAKNLKRKWKSEPKDSIYQKLLNSSI